MLVYFYAFLQGNELFSKIVKLVKGNMLSFFLFTCCLALIQMFNIRNVFVKFYCICRIVIRSVCQENTRQNVLLTRKCIMVFRMLLVRLQWIQQQRVGHVLYIFCDLT